MSELDRKKKKVPFIKSDFLKSKKKWFLLVFVETFIESRKVGEKVSPNPIQYENLHFFRRPGEKRISDEHS